MRIIESAYVFLLGRPAMQSINSKFLKLCLKASGYNNFRNFKTSGEETFLKLIGIKNPKLCIDIGANYGAYSRLLLEKTSAQILAFEPLPDAFSKLCELKDEFPGRLNAINKGVGKKDGVLEIHFNENALSKASFSEEVNKVPFVRNDKSLSVNVVSL